MRVLREAHVLTWGNTISVRTISEHYLVIAVTQHCTGEKYQVKSDRFKF